MKLDNDGVLDVCRRVLAGETRKKVARELGVSLMYVSRVADGRARRDAHPGHPARVACAELSRAGREALAARRHGEAAYRAAVADYKRGHSLRSAADRHGLHWVRLGRWMDARGIPRRPVGKPAKFCRPDDAG